MERVDVAVIGAGVVGCAVASALARRGRSLLLLEKAPDIGEGITSRNSGVIHSGIYYRPRSLKAMLGVEGNRLLYAWCEQKNVPHQRLGKLIVAKNSEEEAALQALEANAVACEANGVELIPRRKLKALEPNVEGSAALYCRESGMVDPIELTRSLQVDAEAHGATLATLGEVLSMEATGEGFHLATRRGAIDSAVVVNAAGLSADRVAEMLGVTKYRIYPCRGDYFFLRSRVRYHHLIYPTRHTHAMSLGIHLTIGLDGQYRLGPDAEYVEERERYDAAEHKREKFRTAAEKLLGSVETSQLIYDSCGIRPKLRGPNDTEEKDFVVAKDLPGLINLIGIESPGLTAALALAELVCELVE